MPMNRLATRAGMAMLANIASARYPRFSKTASPLLVSVASWIAWFACVQTDCRDLAGDCSNDYQLPMLGRSFQGAAGARASPCWSSSIEMPSGDRTKAILPSRGGRLMITPAACSLAQAA